MAKIISIVVLVFSFGIDTARATSQTATATTVLTCHALQEGPYVSVEKNPVDFQIAQYSDGRYFAYSPANRFSRIPRGQKPEVNIAVMRESDITRDPQSLLQGLEVIVQPLTPKVLADEFNLGMAFYAEYADPKKVVLKESKDLTFNIGSREWPIDRMLIAQSRTTPYVSVFMLYDNGIIRMHLMTHVCRRPSKSQ